MDAMGRFTKETMFSTLYLTVLKEVYRILKYGEIMEFYEKKNVFSWHCIAVFVIILEH